MRIVSQSDKMTLIQSDIADNCITQAFEENGHSFRSTVLRELKLNQRNLLL